MAGDRTLDESEITAEPRAATTQPSTTPLARAAVEGSGDDAPSTVTANSANDPSANTFPPRRLAEGAGGLIGPYLLVDRIDAGSQGEVWRALQTTPLNRVVALKVLPREQALDLKRVERLRKEAQRGGQLHHPSILPIYDFGEQAGRAYVAMRLVEGYSLARVIVQRREAIAGRPPADLHRLAILPPEEYRQAIIRLMIDVARALETAHRARIIHRDVKASNILLGREPDERAYLADFGLARDLDDVTQDGGYSEPGTLLYMAPERLRGTGGYDEVRAEIYSLGVTLDEALTLSRPVKVPEGLPRSSWASHLAQAEPVRPRSQDPSMPRDLEAILLKSLDHNPMRRYATAGELADDLERFVRGEPVSARPPGRLRRIARRLSRHRVALVAAASILVALGTILAAGLAVAFRAASLRDEAKASLDAGRPAEAAETARAAIDLAPHTAASRELARQVAEALFDEARNSPEHEVSLLARRWLARWAEIAPDDPRPAARLDQLGVRSVWFQTRPGGAEITLHAVAPDGRPRLLGTPAYRVRTRVDGKAVELPDVLPGTYWATATLENSDAFVERPLTIRGAADLAERLKPIKLSPKPRRLASGARPMVAIPGGTLRMGVNSPQFPEAQPPHPVVVPPFLLDPTEVTNAEFHEFLSDTGRTETARALWPEEGRPGDDERDLPVVNISANLAGEFAAWRGCRLPTEAELEWAARGPSGRIVPEGFPADLNDFGSLAQRFPEVGRIHPVASLSLDRVAVGDATVFGLFANAGELTLFRFRPYAGYLDPVYGPDSAFWRGVVVRCGLIRLTDENMNEELAFVRRGTLPPDETNPVVGFRCARSLRPWTETRTIPGAKREE